MSAGESNKATQPPEATKQTGKLSRLALRAQPDARLVSLAREGHDVAFEEIVRRYRTPLVRFASTIVPADAAEDAVQEALIRAHGAMLADDSELAVRAWLYTIVRNGAVSERRKIRPTEELDETINGVPQPPDIFERRERVRGVVARLKELPEGQREALVRTELGGESADRIAASLSTTPAAVGQLVFRARSALRSGAAVLVPMPMMRMLLELGAGRSGATAGGLVAGAGALAGGGGGGATVFKVGLAAVIAALAVAPGRAPESQLNLEQPTAIDAGTLGPHNAPDAASGDQPVVPESEGSATGAGQAASGARGDPALSSSSEGDDGGGAAGERSSGSGSVKLTSVPAGGGDSDDGGAADTPQQDGGHHGGAEPPPPPPDDDGGDHVSGAAPTPPDDGGGKGDGWDGGGGYPGGGGGDGYLDGDGGYGGGGDPYDGGGDGHRDGHH